MAKMMKKLDSKFQKQQQGRLKSQTQTQQENTTKMKIWKITTANSKFQWTREHILGHDWLTKITWHKGAREVSLEFVKFKTSSTQIFSCLCY